ncbi:hypothetical protein GH714_019382 [Hevea brasiliensis]|uniref:Uncharacterized protein n=1 Tax=Hevea brasiliensis TaxID=3981 RepID=A0A6A6MW18_HEVBR|nr:hypothetical protein GH714_019382 [Hevea brasiliensis]
MSGISATWFSPLFMFRKIADLWVLEDEQIPPLLAKEQPKSKWDDEDVDENEVKESWEDEDEPAPASVEEPPPEKPSKKPVTKSTEKKGKTAKEEPQPLDPVAEKLRQQRVSIVAGSNVLMAAFSRNLKSFHYIGLLKAVMRLSMTSLKAADAKDVASSVTAIANEKLKAEKEANTKKKTGVNSERPNSKD